MLLKLRGKRNEELVNSEIADLNKINSDKDKLALMDFIKPGSLRWALFIAIFIKVIPIHLPK